LRLYYVIQENLVVEVKSLQHAATKIWVSVVFGYVETGYRKRGY